MTQRPEDSGEGPGRAAAGELSLKGPPLRGIKVVDFSVAVSAPYAVALLADQGASVVKVERPGIGDIARWLGVSVNGMSALFLMCNRGKRSIALDLSRPEGIEIARMLVADADVVVQNFRTGVMDSLGLGYSDLEGRMRPSSTSPCRGTAPWAPTAIAVPTTRRFRPMAASPESGRADREGPPCSFVKLSRTRSPRSMPAKRSPRRCSRESAETGASTSKFPWPMLSCPSFGWTPQETRCSLTATDTGLHGSSEDFNPCGSSMAGES